MDADIKLFVLTCSVCQARRNRQKVQPALGFPMADFPMHAIHSDNMQAGGRHFLVITDQDTLWTKVCPSNDITAATTIELLEDLCCTLGKLSVIVSDNGPNFRSQLYKDWCETGSQPLCLCWGRTCLCL